MARKTIKRVTRDIVDVIGVGIIGGVSAQTASGLTGTGKLLVNQITPLASVGTLSRISQGIKLPKMRKRKRLFI